MSAVKEELYNTIKKYLSQFEGMDWVNNQKICKNLCKLVSQHNGISKELDNECNSCDCTNEEDCKNTIENIKEIINDTYDYGQEYSQEDIEFLEKNQRDSLARGNQPEPIDENINNQGSGTNLVWHTLSTEEWESTGEKYDYHMVKEQDEEDSYTVFVFDKSIPKDSEDDDAVIEDLCETFDSKSEALKYANKLEGNNGEGFSPDLNDDGVEDDEYWDGSDDLDESIKKPSFDDFEMDSDLTDDDYEMYSSEVQNIIDTWETLSPSEKESVREFMLKPKAL